MRLQLTANQAQQGGFTGAARAHNRRQFAAINIHIDVVENGAGTAVKRQPSDFN